MPLGLGRRRASGKEYPDDRVAELLSEVVGHQGGDAVILSESVRLVGSYKERVESTGFLTSPPSSLPSSRPPFLHPFRHSHNTPLTGFTAFSLIALILNLLTERILGDSPQMWSACFLFLYRLPFTYDYYTANCSLLQVSVRSLGRPQ